MLGSGAVNRRLQPQLFQRRHRLRSTSQEDHLAEQRRDSFYRIMNSKRIHHRSRADSCEQDNQIDAAVLNLLKKF